MEELLVLTNGNIIRFSEYYDETIPPPSREFYKNVESIVIKSDRKEQDQRVCCLHVKHKRNVYMSLPTTIERITLNMQYNLNFRYIFANKPMLQRVNLITTDESDVYLLEEIFGFLKELPTLTILDIHIVHSFPLNHTGLKWNLLRYIKELYLTVHYDNEMIFRVLGTIFLIPQNITRFEFVYSGNNKRMMSNLNKFIKWLKNVNHLKIYSKYDLDGLQETLMNKPELRIIDVYCLYWLYRCNLVKTEEIIRSNRLLTEVYINRGLMDVKKVLWEFPNINVYNEYTGIANVDHSRIIESQRFNTRVFVFLKRKGLIHELIRLIFTILQ